MIRSLVRGSSIKPEMCDLFDRQQGPKHFKFISKRSFFKFREDRQSSDSFKDRIQHRWFAATRRCILDSGSEVMRTK